MNKKSVNGGVDAQVGFDFQRNCALYLLLDDYESFKEKNFFVCIEHHDDFLYCFRTIEGIENINAYQVKKLSGNIWKIDTRFSEIINKILCVGGDLRNDDILKTENYNHKLTFISNTEFELKIKPNKKEKESGKFDITTRINETYPVCRYRDVHEDIRIKIEEKIEEYCQSQGDEFNSIELENLFIQWVDFPKTPKEQKRSLIGLMKDKFPNVTDAKAAIDLLINLFKDVEVTYNSQNLAKLLDISKRVEGDVIKKAIDVIEFEQKTFDLWREISKEVIVKFRFSIAIRKNAEIEIATTFEYLKDMNNYEHQLIKDYIKNNDYSFSYSDYSEMFQGYIENIKKVNEINLSEKDFFFACLCSYVEYYGG